MKKRLLVLALLLMSGFALVGCGEEVAQGPKGLKGDNGANGKSAYELAVERGYTGTEDEWIDSLTGPRGAEGQPGANGSNAEDGIEYELYVGEDGVIYQRVKGSQEAGEATFAIPEPEPTLVAADFDALLVPGAQLPEGEQMFIGKYYKSGDYHCFTTGSYATPELDNKDASAAGFADLGAEEGKTYYVTCTVLSVNYPYIYLSITGLEEAKNELAPVEREVVATGENQRLLVCPVEKDGVTTYYAAVNIANKYLLLQEVHVNAEGKVIDATEMLLWNITATETEGQFHIASAKYGTTLGAKDKSGTTLLFGGEGEGYTFILDNGLLKTDLTMTQADAAKQRFLSYNPTSPRISAYYGDQYIPAQLMEAVVPAE